MQFRKKGNMLRLDRSCLPVCQISPLLIRPPGGGHLLPGGILVQLRRAPFGFQGTSCGRRRRVRPPGRTGRRDWPVAGDPGKFVSYTHMPRRKAGRCRARAGKGNAAAPDGLSPSIDREYHLCYNKIHSTEKIKFSDKPEEEGSIRRWCSGCISRTCIFSQIQIRIRRVSSAPYWQIAEAGRSRRTSWRQPGISTTFGIPAITWPPGGSCIP